MKEHAIPQDITGYKFHIVGNMTLKQFAETALGFVIAFFIFKTNLYAPVKWLLIAFSASFGAALAFLPIEERPLDHWFITFFTILYKPTKFYWKKKSRVPDAFTYELSKETKTQVDEVDLTPQRRQRISEYLQTVHTEQAVDQEDLYYQQRANQLLSIFDDNSLKIKSLDPEKVKQKPNLKVQVRSLIGSEEIPTPDPQTQEVIPSEQPTEQLIYDLPQTDITYEKQPQEYIPVQKKAISVEEIASKIEIPEIENIKVKPSHQQELQSMGTQVTQQNNHGQEESSQTAYVGDVHEEYQTDTNAQSVTINKDLPFPTKPSKPNKLVGMTLTQDNELINNATITLRDNSGVPVTAVRSNALGQFFITSQLKNGTYTIEVKKTGLSFLPIKISLEGKTVDPLEIRSNE